MVAVIDAAAYPHIVEAILAWAYVVAFESDSPETMLALRAVRRSKALPDALWRYAAFVPGRLVCVLDPETGRSMRHPWQHGKLAKLVRHHVDSLRTRGVHDPNVPEHLQRERDMWWRLMAKKTRVCDALWVPRDNMFFRRLVYSNRPPTIVRRWETFFESPETPFGLRKGDGANAASMLLEEKPEIQAHTAVIFAWPYNLDCHGVPPETLRMHKERAVAPRHKMLWHISKLVINLSSQTLSLDDDWDLTCWAGWNRRIVLNFVTWPAGPHDDSALARMAQRALYLLNCTVPDLYALASWHRRPLYIVNTEGVPDQILTLIAETMDPATAQLATRCRSFRSFIIAFLHHYLANEPLSVQGRPSNPNEAVPWEEPAGPNSAGVEEFGSLDYESHPEGNDNDSDSDGHSWLDEMEETEISSVVTYSGPAGDVIHNDAHSLRAVRFLTSAEYEAEVGTETYRWETMEKPWLAN